MLMFGLRRPGPGWARVSDLALHVGREVKFRHPTRSGERVEGRLCSVGDSELCAAWVRLTIEASEGTRTMYEVNARDWAEVAP